MNPSTSAERALQNFLANLLDTLKNPLFVRLLKSSRVTTEIIP
jgi:hypothetical protein